MEAPDDELIQDRQNDPRSTRDLIELALTRKADSLDPDNPEYWDAIRVLHYRANHDVLEAAQDLCFSEIATQREVGVDILAQLGVPTRTFPYEVVTTLLNLLTREDDLDVLYSIGVALGHTSDARAIEPLIKLKNHPDSGVRYGVVFGLLTHEDDAAIYALMELMYDSDPEVRDWATFGIGTQIDTDTETIREALYQRLATSDDATSWEAIAGLAKRKDPRVIDAIIAELDAGHLGNLIFEAAEEIADSRLYPHLIKAKENWKDPDWSIRTLNDAIAKCQNPS